MTIQGFGAPYPDLEQLQQIARRHPFSWFRRKAPKDAEGKNAVQQLTGRFERPSGVLPAVFLPNYGFGMARTLSGRG